MELRTLRTLELIVAVCGQTIFLAAAWGFFCAIFIIDPVVAPDPLAIFISSRQTETTWVVTLIATIVSVASAAFMSIAIQHALRHRMQNSISLIGLSSGVALARGAFIINFRHPVSALVTLVVFGVTKLLVSSWASLLTPTSLVWPVSVSGSELDITSSWFDSMLQQQYVHGGSSLVYGNSTQIFDLDGVMSGISAAQYSFGSPGLFNFNGAQYNVSTGGILPAAPGYNGTTKVVSDNNTGLAFSGGQVPTHLKVHYPVGRLGARQGLDHSFTILQQGLSARVACRQANDAADNFNFNSQYKAIPVPFANGTTDYWLWAWNLTADCTEGVQARQQYVTRSKSPTVPQDDSSGLLSFLVCPYPDHQNGFAWENFTVITNAKWRYDFLPTITVCEINPFVTRTSVNYSNNTINTTVISVRPLSSGNLTQFLAAIVNHQAETTQSWTTNAIGDSLYAIYTIASEDPSNSKYMADFMLLELEQYWRGVIEFSGTFLRSAFSVDPHTIPNDARIPLSGNMMIDTMGWYRPSTSWYRVIPITVVALITYAALSYTLWHIFTEQGHESFATFDPSNPIHLMMASSARSFQDDKGDLGEHLAGFESGGIRKNENVRVQLKTIENYRKRLQVTGV